MDLGLFVMFNKSMNFIRRLNRGNFYFQNPSFHIWYQGYVTCKNVQNFSSFSLKSLQGKKHKDMGLQCHRICIFFNRDCEV